MKKLFLTMAVVAMSQLTFAQATEAPAVDEKTTMTEEIEQVQLASDLIKYGYANYSATALLQGVEILYAVPTVEATNIEEFTRGEGVDEAKLQVVTYDFAKLIEDARKFANGDANILAWADRVAAQTEVPATTLGAVGGATETHECVLANTTDTYRVRFYAQEQAEVLVSGDGDTDLDLYIYDENGNLIDSDTDRTDTCYCSWTPRWTGVFIIKIKNLGSVRNYYTMWTN